MINRESRKPLNRVDKKKLNNSMKPSKKIIDLSKMATELTEKEMISINGAGIFGDIGGWLTKKWEEEFVELVHFVGTPEAVNEAYAQLGMS